MAKVQSLEDHAWRELNAVNAIDLRKLLLTSIKNEAYDDSGIDNMWVANVEKEVPGIITAYSGDHNFATSSPEENHRVVMEALESGTAIKASILGAVILLIYKVYRVMTNNKAFTSNSGGGRGTTTYNAKKNEELRDAGRQAVETVEKVKENASVASKNKLNLEDDSQPYKAATRFIQTVNPDDAEKAGAAKDPFSRINGMGFDVIYKDAGELPLYILSKDHKDFDGAFAFYTTMVQLASGELRSAFDFHTVNQRIADLTDRLLTMPKEQALRVITSENGVKGLIDLYAQYVGAHLGQVLGDQELIQAKTVSVIRNKMRVVVEEIGKTTTLLKNTPDAPDIMSKDEIIKDIMDSLTGSSESVILKRCELVGKFNDMFQGLLDDYPRDFENSGNGGIREMILNDLDRLIANVKEDESYTPPERNAVVIAATELKSIYEMVQVQILGSIFKFRMNTDKVNRFQDVCIESFLDIHDSGMKFITVIEKSEDF